MDTRAAQEFFRSEAKNLEAANRAVIRATGRRFKAEMLIQLRSFKKTKGSTFRKAVKLYQFESKGSLGPADIVRLGVPFMKAFEEGQQISGKPNLIILLPSGAKLGYKRISKGNPWRKVWGEISSIAKIFKVNDGVVIAISKNGRSVPIYKIQKTIKVPKIISFYDTAKKLGDGMADEVERLLNEN